ncbi:VWA domain-containing protein [Streptomyces sp. NPDC059101]|uniref:vWA domain-containing protein n=1 Tax=Streptomyces sp. NPDC059101 TaxID=3346728 RepID=UPI00369FC9DD
MGIRSLLRNAFGRSKATRDESGAARNDTDKPESATIPEAREESTPAPATPTTATPEAEVPAARTAPGEPSEPTPAPTPVTATVPAQSGPVERVPEAPAKAEPAREEAPVRDEPAAEAAATTDAKDEPAAAPEATEPAQPKDAETDANAGTATVTDQGLEEPAAKDEREPAAEATADTPAAATPAAADSAADLVSQAFDKPADAAASATAADATEPQPDTQPEQAEKSEKAEAAEKPEAAAEAVAAADQPTDEETKQDKDKEGAKEEAAAAAPELTEEEAAPEVAEAPAEAPKETLDEAPKAEADVEETPDPEDTPEAATTIAAEPAPAPDAGNPVAAVAPALLPLYDAARATLEKHHLTTQRATVYLVLDRSGSMRNYYKDGTVQHLAEQALGLSAHLDEKATVPVVFFSTDVDGTADLDLATYEGRIEELHSGLGHMGRTNYHWAIEAVVEHYKKSGSTHPAFVIFQTDGAPTSKPAAERALCEAAGLPIFWQFIGFGDPDAKGFDFLRKLDDLTVPEKRAVDNAGFFHAGRDPRSLSHDALYQQLMVEFPEWLAEARAAKVVKDS